MSKRTELGDFLRSRRARLQPEQVGLAPGHRRQTAGLRREEVALLAGISVDYYIRLEQGRGPQPSDQVLSALGRTLRLTGDEHDYLLRIGGRPPAPRPGSPAGPSPNVLRLLERLGAVPAMVINVCWDVLAWNHMLAALIGDPSDVPARERNTLRWLFGSPTLPPDHAEFARQAVADLRASARHPDDPDVRRLVSELSAASPLFAELWAEREIEVPRTVTKRAVHPVVGEVELDCEILPLPGGEHRLVLYTAAPDSPSHHALQALSSMAERSRRQGDPLTT
ncbi:helix-turn-helix transcriptional regulator [Nonomuraea sp. NPDC050786]|uniref:helix-turn-helix transcriptional regulator n=1 Tax=Nonomuraea sp. NPDC050786 TaxID=3154840 RepID=UPI00340B2DE9